MDSAQVKRLAEEIADALYELRSLSNLETERTIKIITELIIHNLVSKGYSRDQVLDLQLHFVSGMIAALDKSFTHQ